MKRKAYLTIDDTPSTRTDDLVDALCARCIPAILFCRGDLLEQNPSSVIRAIQKGFIIGNHSYQHKRASVLGYDAVCDGIKRTDVLIDNAYSAAAVTRTQKYFRFPYMDRGMGPWLVEPDALSSLARATVADIIKTGLGNDPSILPTAEGIAQKNKLQAFLKSCGYTSVPFQNMNHDFYQGEMAGAIDAMFTTSTSDWAISPRHAGKWGFTDITSLKAALDQNPHLNRTDTSHIILAHDQADLYETVLSLIDHMRAQGFEFEPIEQGKASC